MYQQPPAVFRHFVPRLYCTYVRNPSDGAECVKVRRGKQGQEVRKEEGRREELTAGGKGRKGGGQEVVRVGK